MVGGSKISSTDLTEDVSSVAVVKDGEKESIRGADVLASAVPNAAEILNFVATSVSSTEGNTEGPVVEGTQSDGIGVVITTGDGLDFLGPLDSIPPGAVLISRRK